ncbi:hypothetical protein [Streptomyces acidicola]|uniref:hypothetical protein n=1 Tax=Streptomyces acidicola TaxID=2596892 RepID=UPI003429D01C
MPPLADLAVGGGFADAVPLVVQVLLPPAGWGVAVDEFADTADGAAAAGDSLSWA